MNLLILLIFYESQWKNNKKHWKSEYYITVTSSLGVVSPNCGWGFFVRRWSLCVNFMTLALLVPEPPPPPPPVTDWPKKPTTLVSNVGRKFPRAPVQCWSRDSRPSIAFVHPTLNGGAGEISKTICLRLSEHENCVTSPFDVLKCWE